VAAKSKRLDAWDPTTLKSNKLILQGIGRGPQGNLRNFQRMALPKFQTVAKQVLAENDDIDAIMAVKAEAARRGIDD
jgi:hypothetical protein